MPPKPLLRGCNRPRHQRQSPQRPPPLPPPRSAGEQVFFAPDSSFHQILSVSRKLKTSFHFSQKANGKWYEMIKTDADNSAGVGGSTCNTVSYPTFGSNCNTEMAQFATHKDLQTNSLGFWVGTEGAGFLNQASTFLGAGSLGPGIHRKANLDLVHLYCNWNPLILQILRQIRRNMKKP